MPPARASIVPEKRPNNWATGPASTTNLPENAQANSIRRLLRRLVKWPKRLAKLPRERLAPWLPQSTPARKPIKKKSARLKCLAGSKLHQITARRRTKIFPIVDCRLSEHTRLTVAIDLIGNWQSA